MSDGLEQESDVEADATEIAQAAVESFPIKAIGRRTVDYMARDLMIGSMLRDRRQGFYGGLSKCAPEWIADQTSHVDEKLVKQANQIVALHFVQLLHLQELRQSVSDAAVVNRLYRCLPYGVLLETEGLGQNYQRKICELARLCPFCLARRVTGLYERLVDGLQLGTSQDLFYLARVTLSDQAYDLDADSPLRDQCRRVRARLTKLLIRDAHTIGADGGLTTFTVAPRIPTKRTAESIDPNDSEGFEFRVSLLGRIRVDRPELALLQNSGRGPAIRELDHMGSDIVVEQQILRGRSALRLALSGSSCGYQGPDGVSNVTGVFSWPSWNLATPAQWAAHVVATKGMPQFELWGSWTRRSSAERHQPATPGHCQAQPPRQRNSLVDERRQQLLQSVNALMGSDPGLSSCGRVVLRQKVEAHVGRFPERDVRWLREQLCTK